jgi:flagellin
MANIGATTAFYKVETSLTRANSEVSKSMERLATGKANANAGDRSSYVAMADTFRLDFVGTKAGIKGASVVMGYLETGMRVLDSASALLSRLQELAVLGANDTNTDADNNAINAEAEAIADEFHRLMSTSTYKGKDVFADAASSDYVSMGGRSQEMTFGLGRVQYSNMYLHSYEKYAEEVVGTATTATDPVKEMAAIGALADILSNGKVTGGKAVLIEGVGYTLENAMAAAGTAADDADYTKFVTTGQTARANTVGANIAADDGNAANTTRSTAGTTFVAQASGQATGAIKVAKNEGQLVFAASEGMYHTVTAAGAPSTTATDAPLTNLLTNEVEIVQARLNTARVEAGSQYAALESAVNYTTDLTAQYELGYNTVNDVNFSMETAHLAKNQILQQAATAMLAQANQGQQGLLQLIS